MKFCPGCKQEKELVAFAKNYGRRDGIQSYCRECKSMHDKLYYLKNKKAHLQRVNNLRIRNRQKLWGYLMSHPCVDCGEANPVVLEFDHVAKDKKANISNMINRMRYSWLSVLKEIAKCEVRCANCHRIKTHNQFGWSNFEL